ncbi:nucleotidyltransferase domain-containing protein [Methylobacter sp.]|uniref:nucleotidyltransferase domain-containing protein n=1 Tax=Methylobacter sp. TaxID=2051955 RepID=UPI002FDC8D72
MKYGLKEQTIEQINSVFTRYPEVEQIILYGSRAKGTYKTGSDIDLTLKGNNLDLAMINKISNDIDDLLLPYSFDISIFNQISNANLVDHINRVGVACYESQKSVQRIHADH